MVFDQRVAPSQQEHVRVALLQRQAARLDQVHAQAPAADAAFLAQLRELLGRALHGLREVVAPLRAPLVLGDVVDEHHVEPVDAQALETALDGASCAVGGIVRHAFVGQFVDEGLGVLRLVRRFQQASHLGAEHELVARLAAQQAAEALLGQAGAVVRRDVVVTEAGFPGGVKGGVAVSSLTGWNMLPSGAPPRPIRGREIRMGPPSDAGSRPERAALYRRASGMGCSGEAI